MIETILAKHLNCLSNIEAQLKLFRDALTIKKHQKTPPKNSAMRPIKVCPSI